MPCKDCPLLNQSQYQYNPQNPFNPNNQQKTSTASDRTNNMGFIAVGKVIAVHPKRYTADISLNNESTKNTSSDSNQGENAAPITVSMAGFSNRHSAPYG